MTAARVRPGSGSIDLQVASTLVLCGVAGGSVFILIKALVGQVTPLQLVAARIVLAGLVLLLAMALLKRRPHLTGDSVRGAAILAVIDAIVPFLLIAWAAPHVQASTSALLVATMPLFTAGLVCLTDRTTINLSAIIGIGLGVVGVVILAGPGALDLSSSQSIAMLAVLVSAASYAAAAVYSRSLLRISEPIGLSAVKFMIASAILLPVVSATDGFDSFRSLSLAAWLGLLGVGCLVTGLARCAYLWVIGRAGSVSASMLTYLVPVAALLLGWVFLDEVPSLTKICGALLVLGAVACTMARAGERKRARVLATSHARSTSA